MTIDPRTGQPIVVTNGLSPMATNFLTTTNQELLSANGQFTGTNRFDRDDQRFGTNGLDRDDWRFGTNGFDRDDGRFRHTNDFDRDDWGFQHTNGFGGFSNRFGIFTNSTGTNIYDVMHSTGTNDFRGDIARTPQDAALLQQVRAQLAHERRDVRRLQLSAQNGVVTISAVVPSAEEAQEFVTLVQQTPGVVSVNNNLRIVPGLFSRSGSFGEDTGSTPADQRLVGQVRRHMGRRGQRQAGASESVHIVARNGVITLVGFVSSIEAKQALEAAVQSTPGVVQVDDQLQVRANAGVNTDENAGSAAVGGSAEFGQGTNSSFGDGRPLSTVPFQQQPGNSRTVIIGTNTVPMAPR
jgi:osmotically-inducible protein OsmY